jgi:hypothetical protein
MSDREHLRRLTEAVEALLAGEGQPALDRLRSAAAGARIALDYCPPDDEIASRAGYAAGAASQHTS